MKTIWVVRYNDGTADVFDEDQGPPSWPYVDAFEAKQRIAELEARNKEMMCAMREWYEDGFNRGDCGELIVKHGGEA